MGKLKIIIGVAVFAAAAYYAVKLTEPKTKPTVGPTPSMQPGPAPAATPAAEGGSSMQETLGLTGLAKGALGTVKISENLAIPDSKLRGCVMVKKMEPSPYFPADKNPYFTEKAEDVDFAAKVGFGTIPMIDVAQAGAVLLTNPSGAKTGVWALQFVSADAAANAVPLLRPGVVLRKDGLLLTFWHDPGISDECELSARSYYVDKGFISGMGGPR